MLLRQHTQQHQLSPRSCYFVKGSYKTWRHCLRVDCIITYWYVPKREVRGFVYDVSEWLNTRWIKVTPSDQSLYCLTHTHTVCDFVNQYIQWWEKQRHTEANQQFPKVHARPCDCDRKQHRCSADDFLCVKDPPDTEAHTHVPHQRVLYKHQRLTTTFLFSKKKKKEKKSEPDQWNAWKQQQCEFGCSSSLNRMWGGSGWFWSPSWVGENIRKRAGSLDRFHLTWGV